MIKRILLRLLLVSATLGMVSACGGGSSDGDGDAQVRVVNATADAESIDLTLDDQDDDNDEGEKRFVSAVGRDSQSGYSKVDSANYTARLKRTGSSSSLSSTTLAFTDEDNYTVLAYGREGDYRLYAAVDDEDEPNSGKAKLRVFNAAPDAGSLDIYLTESTASLDDTIPTAAAIEGGRFSAFATIDRGSYRLRVTAANDKDDIRLDVPLVALANKARSTIIIQPGPGGVLVNALVSSYRGDLTAFKNTSARVRLVAGATGNAAVSASLGSTSLNVNLRSPSVASYALVTAGSQTASIQVNSTTTLSGDVSLVAGGDYSLAVYGDSAAPTWRLITDDNRLPTGTDRARIRLLHMAIDAGSNLTLVKDYVGVANSVAYGNASTYTQVTSGSTARIEVSSPLSASPLFLDEEVDLPSRSVFTVFMLSGASTPTGVLRRER